jgi:hypothetical protein
VSRPRFAPRFTARTTATSGPAPVRRSRTVEAFAAAGYELVSVDDLATALDDGAGIETFRPTARKLLARIIPGR